MSAEAPFRPGEEHFRAMIENATDIVTILAHDGTVLYESPSVERLLGYKPEELTGRNCAEIIHPDDLAATMEAIRDSVIAPGPGRTTEFRCLRKDGSWCFLEAVGKSFRSESGMEAIVVNSRDISERKRAEESTRAAQEAAERANRAKSEFLSRMSHELRTPLNAILGFTQLLEIDQPTPSQGESIEHISRAGKSLLSLINEVLDISRLESGHTALAPEPVEVAPFLRDMLALVHDLAIRHQVEVRMDATCEAERTVLADPLRLSQVFLNLLSNAVKYNRPGGQVALSCSDAPGRALRIAVTDTGIGIPAEKMGRLFLPFERCGAEM